MVIALFVEGPRDLEQSFSSTVLELEEEGLSPRQTSIRPILVLERLGVAMPPDIDEVRRRGQSRTVVGLIGRLDAGPGDAAADAANDAQRPPERLGRYELLDELGAGGMGRVYAARDPELGREVAVKVLHPRLQVKSFGIAHFVSEARLTSQLQHPNIIPVHELSATDDGRIFFSMKKVSGQSLGEILEGLRSEAGPAEARALWTPHRLLGVFLQVCHAMGYAHARGVMHRDLTPANIMCGAYGEVLVVDWGLARIVAQAEGADAGRPDPESAEGQRVESLSWGTPGYRSPEQVQGHRSSLTPRSDVFSLGAILYEILTFRRAYDGSTVEEIQQATLRGPVPDPRAAAAPGAVDDEIAELCLRAMAREPAARPADARELAAAVEAFLEGSHRRQQAQQLLAEARARLASAAEQRARAAELAGQAAQALSGTRASDPEQAKAPGWALQDQAEALQDQAALDEARFLQTAQAALERDPQLGGAHQALADYYRAQHEQAVASRDQRSAGRYDLLLRSHDRGAHAEYLAGRARVTLHTDPPGAEVEALVWKAHNRRLVLPETGVALGRTPLSGVSLPIGSYLLRIRAPGRAETHLPLALGRGETWSANRPGSDVPFAVPLPGDGTLGPDDVYVPAGWTPTGGDAGAAGSLPARTIWIDGFIMRRFPVTHGAWLEFLDDLLARGQQDQALRHVPRDSAAKEGDPGHLLYARGADGRFTLAGNPCGWGADHPVSNVDWASAHAYTRWYAERTGLPWRLPCELEWEKAARGVDGRVLPWGWFHDPAWCLTVESHAGAPRPCPVDSFPVDRSPYGVRGLAGGVRDWCLDPFLPEGPAVLDGVLVLPLADPDPQGTHITRGGAWSLPAWVARAAVRGYHAPIRLADLGLRLCRSFGG